MLASRQAQKLDYCAGLSWPAQKSGDGKRTGRIGEVFQDGREGGRCDYGQVAGM